MVVVVEEEEPGSDGKKTAVELTDILNQHVILALKELLHFVKGSKDAIRQTFFLVKSSCLGSMAIIALMRMVPNLTTKSVMPDIHIRCQKSMEPSTSGKIR
jgi:hypothetical protein